MKEKLYHIKTEDGVSIALWQYNTHKDNGKHIFFTHGTFSNRNIAKGIIAYFTERGYTFWVMEWRGHGESSTPKHDYNFESIAKLDLLSTLQFLFTNQKIPSLDCIAHSGGGLALTMLLIRQAEFRERIKTITLFGVQSFAAAQGYMGYLKILASKYFSAVLGYVPAKAAGASDHNESYFMMKQWFNWNLTQKFVGENNFDYKGKMKQIRIPILSICAKGDSFIAPKVGCEKFINAFENPDNKLFYLSKENGNLEDYDHSRIIKSKNAKKEIYPRVEQWLNESRL